MKLGITLIILGSLWLFGMIWSIVLGYLSWLLFIDAIMSGFMLLYGIGRILPNKKVERK